MTVINGIRLVSNSEVTTHQDCPRKWWLAWHRGLTPKASDQTGALAIGTRIHAALASYYVPEGEQPADPMEALRQAQGEAIVRSLVAGDDAADDDRQFAAAQALLKLNGVFDLERAMISGYVEWLAETGADEDYEVIEAERYVEAEFTPGIKLIGKLDALIRQRNTGALKFIDHKTVGTFSVPGLRQNSQMLHYQLIKWLQTGGDVVPEGAVYNMLRKVKRTIKATPPFFQRTAISHNRYELDAHTSRLAYVIAEIEGAETALGEGDDHHLAVPARPSGDCHWKCQFFKICPMFDDGSRVEAAIEDHYEVKSPLHYYGGKELAQD